MTQTFTYDGAPTLCVLHYKFSGKERDQESGLDYFGARYYASSMGRWMSPDWADKPEAVPYSSLSNPQTLNLYSYVGNNPLSHADPDGHCDPDGSNCSVWDHVAGAVGGVLNLVPDTLNLGVSAANHFLSPANQIDSFQRIEPDAHASSPGMTTGTVASFAVPVGGEMKGLKLAEGLTVEVRASAIEKEAGIVAKYSDGALTRSASKAEASIAKHAEILKNAAKEQVKSITEDLKKAGTRLEAIRNEQAARLKDALK